MLGFEKTYTLPFEHDIPNHIEAFLSNNSLLGRRLKYFKRKIFLQFKGQAHLETSHILPEHMNILWINMSAPSLGDSLMDLSSRVLLHDRMVDLFTDKKNAVLYIDDNNFRNVYTTKREVNTSKYDLVIIDSYSTRSVSIKAAIAPEIQFIGMYAYFNGPEVNRVLFSFHRLNQLLGYTFDKVEINTIARTSIAIPSHDKAIVRSEKLPSSFITIAIGGEWEFRTYKKWDELVRLLIEKDNNINIVLVGSSNAIRVSEKLLANCYNGNVFDYVAKYSFKQTSQIISQSKIFISCDGGLMHAANAVKTPILPLLSRLDEKMQLTESIQAFPLFDKSNVNNITENSILKKYIEASNYVGNHPRVE